MDIRASFLRQSVNYTHQIIWSRHEVRYSSKNNPNESNPLLREMEAFFLRAVHKSLAAYSVKCPTFMHSVYAELETRGK